MLSPRQHRHQSMLLRCEDMGIPWTDSIKSKGQLTFRTVNEDSWGALKTAFNDALTEFNSTAKRNKLCVTFTRTQEEAANIQVEAAEGPRISYTYEGSSESEEFSGSRLHGRTIQLEREGKMEKAFMFIPKSPQISTPSAVRPAGAGVLKLIAFHELIHATGLENSDHVGDDIFQAQPQPYPGDTPSGDGLMIGSTSRHMPPIILSRTTIQRVKALWCPAGGSLTAKVHYKMGQSARK